MNNELISAEEAYGPDMTEMLEMPFDANDPEIIEAVQFLEDLKTRLQPGIHVKTMCALCHGSSPPEPGYEFCNICAWDSTSDMGV